MLSSIQTTLAAASRRSVVLEEETPNKGSFLIYRAEAGKQIVSKRTAYRTMANMDKNESINVKIPF
jgi:hypothetical protein